MRDPAEAGSAILREVVSEMWLRILGHQEVTIEEMFLLIDSISARLLDPQA